MKIFLDTGEGYLILTLSLYPDLSLHFSGGNRAYAEELALGDSLDRFFARIRIWGMPL